MLGLIRRYWSWRRRREVVPHHRNNQFLKIGRRRFNSFSAATSYPLHTWMWWRYKEVDEAGLVAYIAAQRWTGFIAYTLIEPAYVPLSDRDPVLIVVANLDSDLVYWQYARFRMTLRQFGHFFHNHSELEKKDVRAIEDAICWRMYGF